MIPTSIVFCAAAVHKALHGNFLWRKFTKG